MERSKRMLFLLCVCLLVVAAGFGIAALCSSKRKASKEMQVGIQVLKNPESLVEDLIKE